MSQQVLNDRTYSPANVEALTGGRARTATMSYGGVIVKSTLLLAITIAFAFVGWNAVRNVLVQSSIWFFLGYIVLIALTFAAVHNPRIAAVAGLVYAALMGTWMGAISRLYEAYYEGIVGAAIGVTLAVFLSCLLLYSVRAIRVTSRFVAILSVGMFGILLLYGFGWFLSIFGVRLNFLYDASPTGIAISVVIALLAAMSLIADFAIVETGVKQGAPKDFEWYAAFGLQTTLVWLYLEILLLLARLRG